MPPITAAGHVVIDTPSPLHFALFPVQIVALIATIAQYLSPYPVIRRIARQNNTGHFSYLPYLTNFINSCLSTFYGFLIRDTFVMMLNSFGVTVTAAYLFAYQRYYHGRMRLLVEIFLSLVTLLGACYQASNMEESKGRYFLGAAQNFISIACFVAPLATVRVVFESRSAESVPFLLALMNFFSSLSWYFYGVIIDDWFVQLPNLLGIFFSLMQLSLFVIFPPARFVVI
ncbi:hypothetical protein GUITHDRAFT_101039 [Guillardia theta CCMP2712]|uniref:Sugar transporter SWEET1 n=1 Tax=Guillardia theta (strain CCMP2712) TaxID=905079 RepID=L1JZ22_GUITC|nr:hypothetical protein GUITHDRAFT_101039 [Guillardia theta CCMP2712]EKX53338.1 hypothetical protein GUITHDRAFT_101039 [Guillardia theta CCMP2712]|mmetsp:Transcript_35758/g.111871  ORF Transcript_35758/g.111871 Transcript_35758/m.111871 type:complete len:229 (-) Transcript_35758:1154-1840(-)|eukprot:XP_005840318.1 hypothetical protein GUITHDRAFT_101039 [Guillardia theta CCMP2712]